MSKSLSDRFGELFRLKDVPFMGVPDYMFNIEHWLGGVAASALAWQAITGLLLLLYYQPSNAYDSTMAIIHNVPFGSILLSSHLYGAYIMILAVYLHGLYIMISGGYKKPRGVQWVLGVLLFAMTLGVAFIGYSMTGDVLAADAVDVGRGILTSLGLQSLAPVLFGNGTTLDLFTRLLGWHIIIAAAIILFFVIHFYLAEAVGLMPRLKDANYKAPAVLDKATVKDPWWPRNFVYMIALAFMVWGVILLLPSILALPSVYPYVPVLFSPYPGPSPTSPQAALVPAYPPWFFLMLYKMADMPLGLRNNMLLGAIVPLVILLLIPIFDRGEKLHPMDRPAILALALIGLTWLIELSSWSAIQPGIPVQPLWGAIVLLPPLLIIVAGIYLLHRQWLKVRDRALARREEAAKTPWALSSAGAQALAYLTAVLAIIMIGLSFVLDPLSEGPYIGILWGAAFLSLSASIYNYFYITYILNK
ncbi:Cytochrome b subunit of the bc complex [Thermoproteus uzoniensis 768-20]|uniref:Cytochrome b subunit of the bc complex n=1 Tax=Thermoproteus uzoniensis (strain 768-20) TaxID=999630 RepID=F2L5B3_THEU7|nr:cytochrome bc complex cytochrome b subunit [Thermoproteus uzoniensis]AEA13538.1 Cytochrome b subunit of the bc complex [Thermoproteus uzoniensis 768-20]